MAEIDEIDEIQVPVYLMAGFLDSGKSTFLNFTIAQDYFALEETTLLILCEEGEVEYDPRELKKYNTVMEVIEEPQELTPQRLAAMDIACRPGRIVIEYNGMWPVSALEEMELPRGWGIVQHITTVDASTFQVYMNNMKSLFMEMVRGADLVIFNRCEKGLPLATFRRSVKVVNQSAEIIFEDEQGEIENIFEDEMPFDLDADVISIREEDYGIWYIDAMDHPERYKGKTVEFTGMVLKSKEFPSKMFVPGRMAMTCCADDTTFIGYVCRSPYAPKLKTGQWVKVTASVGYDYVRAYHGEGPVLEAKSVELTEPLEEELVYFN
ncbi:MULTISPECIES: GTP-binding protein [unclassified Lactonifactor]|uniref:TIGR03943 family putative permease subunit n=1 Tax=unclassified Lactonifactor TaxID=2636670 RepID=UPI0012B159D2|nr:MULTISPECIES: GTP-binding protein [unclassified Lactonifactor]